MGAFQPNVAIRYVALSWQTSSLLILHLLSEHFATLTTTLDQASDSTKLTLNLDGVPTGMEDELKRNIEGY